MRVTNAAALRYPDERRVRSRWAPFLTRTMVDSDSKSLMVRRHSAPELKSLIVRPGHPQRVSNHPSGKTGLQQINALTAAHDIIIKQAPP
ncbi:hypothetical protein CRG98_042114 [Punica granatum]|uniref:Uncharacterized protein n=1 Tax=Punica granatum TaxID=22663 RepID=A0A2I0I170_PUNGR|nr:hypothetical protein CRG98_042114 [Punica granatum]